MITKISGGKVISDRKIFDADVYIKDGRILDVTKEALPFDEEIDAKGNFVAPSFVEIHCHGGADCDFLDNDEESFIKIAKAHAQHGVGTIIPTITSSDIKDTLKSIEVFENAAKREYNGAEMPGIHLEGPYFAESQKGAQDPRYIRDFDKKEYEKILSATDKILRWTGAPERKGAEEFAKTLKKYGCLPCIGHSDADGDEVKKAFEWGFTHITHLYSCTSTVHRKNAYRYIGIVESAYLIDDMTVEIIADGIHLPADLLKLVYKIKGPEKTALITDAMRGAGMPDGPSVLGKMDNGLDVIIEDDVAKLPDRSAFAGSVAFFDRLVRNMVKLAEVPLEDAVLMATRTPADIVGLKNKGSLAKGFDGDVVIFDKDINIIKNIVGGKTVYSNE